MKEGPNFCNKLFTQIQIQIQIQNTDMFLFKFISETNEKQYLPKKII